MSGSDDPRVTGLNGVSLPGPRQAAGPARFRTYEVYQRERVGQSTEKIKPMQLVSPAYAADPFPLMGVLRDNYPCYRDWVSNCYWVTGYNDVTSIFTDDANFENRSKLWYYQWQDFGRNLGELPEVEACWAHALQHYAVPVAEELLQALPPEQADLALNFAARFNIHLLARLLDLPADQIAAFGTLFWNAQRGAKWQPQRVRDGRKALQQLVEMFTPLLAQRSSSSGEDLISVVAASGGSAADLTATLLESDHETLHGALANLLHQLLAQDNPQILEQVGADSRLLKVAYLETLRHSPPVVTWHRFARREVERFGRLLPEGALIKLSAAGANRDPRIFHDADTFVPFRADICHREPRGQFRADGLASGIAFALGKPSIHPAVPEDRPPSRYALTRDAAISAIQVLLQSLQNLQLAEGQQPLVRCLGLDEMYTCWSLPVTYQRR